LVKFLNAEWNVEIRETGANRINGGGKSQTPKGQIPKKLQNRRPEIGGRLFPISARFAISVLKIPSA
jgi:hypothetical protein